MIIQAAGHQEPITLHRPPALPITAVPAVLPVLAEVRVAAPAEAAVAAYQDQPGTNQMQDIHDRKQVSVPVYYLTQPLKVYEE